MKFEILYKSRWLLLYGPILLIAAALLWLSYTQWMPQPPTQLTIVAGQPGDSHTQLALRYRERLSQLGIEAEVLTDEITHNAIQALRATPPTAQLALASGLNASKTTSSDTVAPLTNKEQRLQGLAVIEREPVWIFTRVALATRVQDLRNMRVGIADNDQLATQVVELVLQQAQMKLSDVQMIKVPRLRIANQLIDGQLDAVILLASAQNETVRVLTRSNNIQILGLDQVRGLIQREPRLRPFVLPQGVIEFRGDIPPRDLTMVASDLQLVIHETMHPALQRALLDVANQLHETPNFLQRQGEFPNVLNVDFSVSPVSLASMRGNKPWLEQLLPYRWAQLAEWLLFALLPIALLSLFLLAWVPSWFDWRINAMLQNFYGELKFLETEIDSVASERPIEMQRLMQRIDAIDVQLMQLELPNQFAPRWYTLRSHLSDARDKLLSLRAR